MDPPQALVAGAQLRLCLLARGDLDRRADELADRSGGIAGKDGIEIVKPVPFARVVAHPVLEVGDLVIPHRAHALEVRREARQVVGVHEHRHDVAAHGDDFLRAVAEHRGDRPTDENAPLLLQIEDNDDARAYIGQALQKVFALAQLRFCLLARSDIRSDVDRPDGITGGIARQDHRAARNPANIAIGEHDAVLGLDRARLAQVEAIAIVQMAVVRMHPRKELIIVATEPPDAVGEIKAEYRHCLW